MLACRNNNVKISRYIMNQTLERSQRDRAHGDRLLLLSGGSRLAVFWVRARFISLASSVNFSGSCSFKARADSCCHRSKFIDHDEPQGGRILSTTDHFCDAELAR